MDEIARNFIVANYNSLGAVDNGVFGLRASSAHPSLPCPHCKLLLPGTPIPLLTDDGSSFYHTHHNFFGAHAAMHIHTLP